MKTHIACALPGMGRQTDLGRNKVIAIKGGTLFVGCGSEVHIVKCWTNARSCEMKQVVRLLINN
jgi:hypothetical protein